MKAMSMDAAAFAEMETLRAALSSAQEAIGSLKEENKLLRQKIDLLIKKFFGGRKSEAIDSKQLEMLLAGLVSAAPAPAPVATNIAALPRPQSPRPKPVRQPLPDHLPEERVVLIPEEVKARPEHWKEIGQEITEELDWKPSEFFKRVYIRPKYVKLPVKTADAAQSLCAKAADKAAELVAEATAAIYGQEEAPVRIAPLPSRLIEKGFPGPGLLAQVVISKYEDHLPLYRQEKIYRERYGVKLSRQTLGEWVEKVAFWLSSRSMNRSGKGCWPQVICKPMRHRFGIWTPTCPARVIWATCGPTAGPGPKCFSTGKPIEAAKAPRRCSRGSRACSRPMATLSMPLWLPSTRIGRCSVAWRTRADISMTR